MKHSQLIALICVALQAESITKTVCLAGPPTCDYATFQAAMTAAHNLREASCQQYLFKVLAGEVHAQTDLTGGGVCRELITVRGSRTPELPYNRVDPALHASLMPTIQTNTGGYALRIGTIAGGGAHDYRFEGIRFATRAGEAIVFSHIYAEIDTGNGSVVMTSPASMADHITLSRVIVEHDYPTIPNTHGVTTNASDFTLEDSWIDGMVDSESHAAGGCVGHNIRLRNNFFRASGISVLFGGCNDQKSSALAALYPVRAGGNATREPIPGYRIHNVEVSGNYSTKHLYWFQTSSTADSVVSPCLPGAMHLNSTANTWQLCVAGVWVGGQSAPPGASLPKQIKNHYDAKTGSGFDFFGNFSEHGMYQGQNGYGIIVNSSPLSSVRDLSYRYNHHRRTGSVYVHAIAPAWGAMRVENNVGFDLIPPGMAPPGTWPQNRYMIRLDTAESYVVRNNSIHTTDASPTLFVFSDNRPQTSARGGAYRDWSISANVLAGTNAGTFGGSGWGPSTGSFCRLNEYVPGAVYETGWRMPAAIVPAAGGYVTVEKNVFAGTLNNGTQGTTGAESTCDYLGVGPVWPSDQITRPTVGGVFADASNGDLSLIGGPWLASGRDGKNLGANVPGALMLSANAVNGQTNAALEFKVTRISRSVTDPSLILVNYQPIPGATCAVSASTLPDFSAAAGTVTSTGYGAATVSSATAVRSVRVACGGLFFDTAI